MSNLTVTVATAPVILPVGVTAGQLQINVFSVSAGVATAYQSQTVAGTTATFDNVPVGTYHAVAQMLDSTGVALGSPVQSADITIATYAAPVSVTVALS